MTWRPLFLWLYLFFAAGLTTLEIYGAFFNRKCPTITGLTLKYVHPLIISAILGVLAYHFLLQYRTFTK